MGWLHLLEKKSKLFVCVFLSHQRRVFDIHIFDENLQKQNIQKSWCHGLINQTLSSSKITNKPLQRSNNQISEQWVFHPIKKSIIDITVYFPPNGKDYTGYLEHGNIEL